MSHIQFNPNEIHHDTCQICGGAISLLFRKSTAIGVFDIVRCSACRFAFVNPTPSLKFIEEFYAHAGQGNYSLPSAEAVCKQEDDDPNAVVDASRIALNLKAMTSGRNLLDVGCGYGLFSLEAIRQGFSVDAMEIADAERAIATEVLGFSPTLTTFEKFQPGRIYNAIILSQVFEHAREPVEWIRKVRDLLAPGGVAVIALPNFSSFITDILKDGDPYVTPPAHLNYFGPDNLRRIAELNGFAVIKTETLTRISKRAFIRRFGRLAGGALHRVFPLATSLLDVIRKGNMLNIYIRRGADISVSAKC